MNTQIDVKQGEKISFHNGVDFCVGTGRMGLALQKEYLEQLKLVQENIGFKYIRGHGLFCDDMAIFHRYVDEAGKEFVEYNFTYLDRVLDSYRELGLRPFLELGFMPSQMASGEQTVFYWKGNVTPPKSYEEWIAMVQALLIHLIERYGVEDVIQWPIEVWNEPNLKVFWKDADMEEYFRLYEHTAFAVKKINSNFRIGGPAVCGGNDEIWVKSFLHYVKEQSVPLDFITRHHYTTHLPEKKGHYGYAKLHDLEEGFVALEKTRDIVDSFDEFKEMEIHITEFNTSYIPNCPLHDTNLNGAYIAAMLSRLGDKNTSYSYWTFGDVFEEGGVPFTPFHGGFGMVANGCIPKPTFWTFAFYKQLQGDCVFRSKEAVIVQLPDQTYRGVLWNLNQEQPEEILELNIQLPVEAERYCLITKTVDEECCNPLKVWHDMGEPPYLSEMDTKLLREHAVPLTRSKSVLAADAKIEVTVTLQPNAVVYFELFQTKQKSDRGYSYERVMKSEDLHV